MKTFNPKPDSIQRKWYIVDAKGKTLGRLATEIARRLKGKHRPEYSPHWDMGDYIVVINSGQVRVTGRKAQGKIYHSHTGFPGGIKSVSFEKLVERSPNKAIELAVKGMLPRSPLGRQMQKKLKIYSGVEHPHGAQQPEVLEIEE